MIEYRHFRNDDPPRLLELWNQSGLSRGAATGIALDHLDLLLFSQPYFDRHGLILACHETRVIGMVHAGFGRNESGTDLDQTRGVICQVIVHPEYRRQGVGRTLVDRALVYLRDHGATSIHAGTGPELDPFYCGLYGGSQSAGFLSTDASSSTFLESAGFQARRRFAVFQRPLELDESESVDFRSVQWKRRVRVEISAQRRHANWWWTTRLGRLDYVRFRLLAKDSDKTLASLTLLGLDQYAPKWEVRAIGLTDIHVAEDHRRQGLGRLLISETLRRLKQETISLVESHADENDGPLSGLLAACSFQRVDAGTQWIASTA